jgi:hypothetical protein
MTEKAKTGAWFEALRDAARELSLPKTDFRVERLATMRLALALQRQSWTTGRFNNTSDILSLMDSIEALRREAKDAEPTTISVNIVQGVKGSYRCQHCGKQNTLTEGQYEPAKRSEAAPAPTPPPTESATSDVPNEPVQPAKPDPDDGIRVRGYREGVSASGFHAQVLSNDEVPPLKKRQGGIHTSRSRSVSPLSYGALDMSPRRHNAPPQGSALDELNPNRKH